MVLLECLSNFWITLEMTLINYDINLILTWSAKCLSSDASNQEKTFIKIDPILFATAVTLSTQDNTTLLQTIEIRS